MIPGFSFKKSQRLLNKNDFQNLRSGSRFFVSEVLVFYVKNNSIGHDRIGIAVSKKYGNAVKRNRAKRIIRENFRLSDQTSSSCDVLVSMNLRNIKNKKLPYSEIEKKITSSFTYAISKEFIS